MPLRKYSSAKSNDRTTYSDGFVVPSKEDSSGGGSVIPPPADGFAYVAFSDTAGKGYWFGPFYLKTQVANGVPSGKATLEIETNDAVTYPMFEGQE